MYKNAVKLLNDFDIKTVIRVVYRSELDIEVINELKKELEDLEGLDIEVSIGTPTRITRNGVNISELVGSTKEEYCIVPGLGMKIRRGKIRRGCKDAGTTLTIDPYGYVYTCCGRIIARTNPEPWLVRPGHIESIKLYEAAQRIQCNALIWWLHVPGPHRLAEEIGR